MIEVEEDSNYLELEVFDVEPGWRWFLSSDLGPSVKKRGSLLLLGF